MLLSGTPASGPRTPQYEKQNASTVPFSKHFKFVLLKHNDSVARPTPMRGSNDYVKS
jgi:hypothetical protein